MMPGMPPPPGAYMPGPFMQPMPYPPGMVPPNGQRESVVCAMSYHLKPFLLAMYAPAMGQMPRELALSYSIIDLTVISAPQAYMPPPPGSYPPPPNGAGPRPSMPPTPIPAHAHPYYHQSPQRTTLLN